MEKFGGPTTSISTAEVVESIRVAEQSWWGLSWEVLATNRGGSEPVCEPTGGSQVFSQLCDENFNLVSEHNLHTCYSIWFNQLQIFLQILSSAKTGIFQHQYCSIIGPSLKAFDALPSYNDLHT